MYLQPDLDSASSRAFHQSNQSLSIDSSDSQDTLIIEENSSRQGTSAEAGSGGPTVRQQSEFNPETILSEDECKEAITTIWFLTPCSQIEQDFVLVFGEEVTGKLLEKWTTAFKKTMIQQWKSFQAPSGTNMEEHLREITAIV
ncbi:DNA polymerase III subunit alpha [Labeo rohita]|uniref:DNA polymerase III subunit alpha n=1 Tax=Labeo rohita TaxID=84645 RepID=A0ABQ8MX08_LABRO|nr:DNA polymerase III subunit alpha [Labeo rohita]